MKDKLTLTIDRAAIARAKAFARREKTSLSQLVEEQFQRLGSKSFAEKWYGAFEIPTASPNDPRLNHLLKKYVHRP